MASSPFFVLARQLSTSSASQQLVKAPVQLFTIEGRYATALYSAATKKKVLPQVEKDLKEFDSLMKTDKPLRELLLNPLVKKDLKKDAISSVLAIKKASPLTVNLFGECFGAVIVCRSSDTKIVISQDLGKFPKEWQPWCHNAACVMTTHGTHNTVSHHTASPHTASHHTASHHIASPHTASHHTASPHTASHHTAVMWFVCAVQLTSLTDSHVHLLTGKCSSHVQLSMFVMFS
ncbi:ATPase OSCP/delta subunit [Trinorchestia longiramus]|nr:ATPase OSCP/delta subunit [Trinorchestia longiramus]